mmetsp:Transcript_95792/g.139923  ORF Transcript_95792/g.139923 Transcript_95792/m.139923 type:complete len:214 (+) Transcript_95792:2562-3203(+)
MPVSPPSERRWNMALNQKTEPLPSLLSTPIVPFISSANCFEIASPSPVPPYVRVVDESTCEKRLNSFFCPSSEMPIPESYTLNRNVTCDAVNSSVSTTTYTCPLFVNLIPFDRRFSRICLSRSGSPSTAVDTVGSRYEHISSPFPRALEATESTASSMTCRTSNCTEESSNLPASTLVRSKMSLMRISSDSDDVMICSVNFRCSAERIVSMMS